MSCYALQQREITNFDHIWFAPSQWSYSGNLALRHAGIQMPANMPTSWHHHHTLCATVGLHSCWARQLGFFGAYLDPPGAESILCGCCDLGTVCQI